MDEFWGDGGWREDRTEWVIRVVPWGGLVIGGVVFDRTFCICPMCFSDSAHGWGRAGTSKPRIIAPSIILCVAVLASTSLDRLMAQNAVFIKSAFLSCPGLNRRVIPCL